MDEGLQRGPRAGIDIKETPGKIRRALPDPAIQFGRLDPLAAGNLLRMQDKGAFMLRQLNADELLSSCLTGRKGTNLMQMRRLYSQFLLKFADRCRAIFLPAVQVATGR